MHVTLIAGARPNFMKIAPIINAIQNVKDAGKNINFTLVHTGQHFDERMSALFFKELEIPEPDINLQCGGGSQAEQTAAIMVKFEHYLQSHFTNLVMVVGDVTSTLACSIVAKKMGIKVAHVEAGIRSGDWSMPEEINRIVTDSIADYFFTTTLLASENLIRNGVNKENIFWVGNTMIDTLRLHQSRFKKPTIADQFKLEPQTYLVLTLHRPNNVDDTAKLKTLLDAIMQNAAPLKVILPIHPRTRKVLSEIKFEHPSLIITDPLGYLEFNYLVMHAKGVITDSGGITEETTVMGIPCITLRDTTERPETVSMGTNELIGTNPSAIPEALYRLKNGTWKKGKIPPLWDGKTGERIIDILLRLNMQ